MLKRFAIPLQAFGALFACVGMFWMIFVVAGFNPTPPTAQDLQARNTQDLSFASMNSTAAALAFDMLEELAVTPIVMPVTGNESTLIPTPTIVVTLRAVYTFVSTNTPFPRLFPGTATERPDRPARTPTPIPTFTPRPPTATATLLPTQTRPPTLTFTPVPPTRTPSRTPVPSTPTDDPTNTPETPTDVPIETPNTPVPDTETPPTHEPTATSETTSVPIDSTPDLPGQPTESTP